MAIVFASTACGNNVVLPDVLEITVQVQGTITAVGTGNPIEDAFLEVRTTTTGVLFAETTTDENGLYSLSFIYRFFRGERPFCPFIFLITAPGFFGDTPQLACVEEVQTIDVQLEPA